MGRRLQMNILLLLKRYVRYPLHIWRGRRLQMNILLKRYVRYPLPLETGADGCNLEGETIADEHLEGETVTDEHTLIKTVRSLPSSPRSGCGAIRLGILLQNLYAKLSYIRAKIAHNHAQRKPV